MSARRRSGNETWFRLRDWTGGPPAAERLAAQVLRAEGFQSVDPVHPLGGPDHLKDIVCWRDNQRWIAAAYFPREERPFRDVARKFAQDVKGVPKNQAQGFCFVTNQELSDGERAQLVQRTPRGTFVELYHRERLASLLDSPLLYGVRLEFLGIPMTQEEQLSFFQSRDVLLDEMRTLLQRIAAFVGDLTADPSRLSGAVPLAELQEFSRLLNSISGISSLSPAYGMTPHVGNLRVPLQELQEFVRLLGSVTGVQSLGIAYGLTPHVANLRVPLDELREYVRLLERITGRSPELGVSFSPSPVTSLSPPIEALREFSRLLDEVLAKVQQIQASLPTSLPPSVP